MMKEVLRCLVLPIQGRILLLPYSAVSEVVPLEKPGTLKHAKYWRQSSFAWRGLDIPLICFVKENSQSSQKKKETEISPGQHIAVLNRCGDLKECADFYGILLAGTPNMGRFKPSDLQYLDEGDEPYFSMKVLAKNTEMVIPNLAWIEQQLH